MPQIPEFRQSIQGVQPGISPEDPRVARQRGSEFSSFSQQAANLGSTLSEYKRRTDLIAFQQSLEQQKLNASSVNGRAFNEALIDSKPDGTDLVENFNAKFDEGVAKNLEALGDNEELRKATLSEIAVIKAKSEVKLLTHSRNRFNVEALRIAQREIDERSNLVASDPSMLDSQISEGLSSIDKKIDLGLLAPSERSKYQDSLIKNISQGAINGSIINKDWDGARDILKKQGSTFSVNQRVNLLNIIDKRETDERSNALKAISERRQQVKEAREERRDRAEEDIGLRIIKAKRDGVTPEEEQTLLDELYEVAPITGPKVFFKLKEQLTDKEDLEDNRLTVDFNDRVSTTNSSHQLDDIRDDLYKSRNELSIETYNDIRKSIRSKKVMLKNRFAQQQFSASSKRIDSLTLPDSMIARLDPSEKTKQLAIKSLYIQKRAEGMERGLDALAAVDAARIQVDQIVNIENELAIPGVDAEFQDTLDDFKGASSIKLKRLINKNFAKDPKGRLNAMIKYKIKKERLEYLETLRSAQQFQVAPTVQ